MSDADALQAGLLGSTGPDVSCEECFDLLDRYVEAELITGRAAGEWAAMANHLRNCPACHEEYESLRELVAADGSGQPGASDSSPPAKTSDGS
jgi:hypothetical protein